MNSHSLYMDHWKEVVGKSVLGVYDGKLMKTVNVNSIAKDYNCSSKASS